MRWRARLSDYVFSLNQLFQFLQFLLQSAVRHHPEIDEAGDGRQPRNAADDPFTVTHLRPSVTPAKMKAEVSAHQPATRLDAAIICRRRVSINVTVLHDDRAD